MKYSLVAGLLALVGCSYRPAPAVAVPPTPTPTVMALPAPPLGQAVATAQALPLLGSPVVSVTAPPTGFTSVVFAQLPGTLPPGAGVLGFVSPLGQYVAIGLDPSVILDTTSNPYPVLRAAPGSGTAVTHHATFSAQADGTWRAVVGIPPPLPPFDWLLILVRNRAIQSEKDATLAYDASNGGMLILTPVGTWALTDDVRVVWVY